MEFPIRVVWVIYLYNERGQRTEHSRWPTLGIAQEALRRLETPLQGIYRIWPEINEHKLPPTLPPATD